MASIVELDIKFRLGIVLQLSKRQTRVRVTVSPLVRQSDALLTVRPIAHDTSSPPENWYQNLVLETLLVCHAFWYQIFLLPETWIDWDRVLFCTRNLTSRDSHAGLALVVEFCLHFVLVRELSALSDPYCHFAWNSVCMWVCIGSRALSFKRPLLSLSEEFCLSACVCVC